MRFLSVYRFVSIILQYLLHHVHIADYKKDLLPFFSVPCNLFLLNFIRDVLIISINVSADFSIHQVLLSQKNFCLVGKECISLMQHLLGLNDHQREEQLLGLKNRSDSCVPCLDYTPKICICYITLYTLYIIVLHIYIIIYI